MDERRVILGKEKKLSRYGYLLYLALFISLFVHLLFVGFSFRYSFHKHAKAFFNALMPALSPEEKKIQQERHEQRMQKQQQLMSALAQAKDSKRVARLRPGKSDFGWVVFDREPTKLACNEPPEIPTTTEGTAGQAMTVLATEQKVPLRKRSILRPIRQAQGERDTRDERGNAPKPKEIIKKEMVSQPVPVPPAQEVPAAQTVPISPVPAKEAPVVKDLAQVLAEPKPEPKPETKPEVKPEQKQEPKPVSIAEQNAETLQRIKKIEAMQKKLNAYSGSDSALESTKDLLASVIATPEGKDTGIGETQEQGAPQQPGVTISAPGLLPAPARGARSMSGTKKRDIIALTRGFIEQRKDLGGTDPLERDGDDSIRPSFEDLKYLSYETKLTWCLQASWKQNFAINRYEHPMEGDAVIEFTIDEHGNLVNSKMLSSTGFVKLDSMIMKTTELAAPFPPLPKFFETSRYTTGRRIQVRTSNVQF